MDYFKKLLNAVKKFSAGSLNIYLVFALLFPLELVPVSADNDIWSNYRVYLSKSNKYVNLAKQEALWFESDYADVEEYASQVVNSPKNPLGQRAIIAFGSIGNDDNQVYADNGEIYNLVGSPSEYYFTDMVFIKGEFEKAITELYI